ncbi:MAG: sulfite exporter TauE/SafE family protein [Gammaproteobacteria bacterium HGW-Gammaproteobacteria-10]|nr:MAG: sulfite exporter TauE/SafE family protein [Gammaproteobacteria bacterium HGW-Gammaproteobacteria-10]
MFYTVLFLASLVAFSISAICGGGAGLLLIPILGFSLPVTQVPAALTIGTATSSVSRIWLFFNNIRWDIVKWFLPSALPGVIFGSWLLNFLDPLYLELCMGLFLVSNLPLILRKSKKHSVKSVYPLWVLSVTGFFAGLISGITGAVGVLFNRFYYRYGMHNEEVIATRAANESLLHLVKLYLYASFGLLTLKASQIGLVIAIAAIVSTWFMKKIVPKISMPVFSKLGYTAMVVSGVLMLNSAIARINVAHNPDLMLKQLNRGIDASFKWSDLIYTLEFRYEEGFEFEKIVPLSSLPANKQNYINSQRNEAGKIVIEKVYTIRSVTYEAYFYDDQNNLLKKLKIK